ncbi:branched-chain amino acid ABC transporter permease [Acholeplasma hippikon]|nr:branched-chain amino acid ABC transporter permease [Acholeplasma hippikon]
MNRFIEDRVKPILKKPQMQFVFVGIVLLVVRALSSSMSVTNFSAIVQTSYYFLAGLGFALLLGYGGLASLGTGAFVGIGSFALHYFYKYMNQQLLVAIVLAIIISIIVSLLFGFVSLRISGMYLAIVTMGLSQIVVEVIKNFSEYASGTTAGFLINPNRRPLELFGYVLKAEDALIFSAVFIVLGMIIIHNLIHSATGRALLSIKNSETAAQTMGIGLIKYRLTAFIISGVFGTLAGVLSILFTRGANVSQIGLAFALNILAAVVIGGTKSIWGIMLGSFVIFGLDLAVLQKLNLGSYSPVINGVLIIVVVMFYPGGLIQIFTDLKIKIKLAIEKKKKANEEKRV